MISKFKVKSEKLKVLGLFFVFTFMLYTLYFVLYTSKVSAATCQQQTTYKRAEGLISSVDVISNFVFGNPSQTCVIGTSATFSPFNVQSYDDLKSLFYDQSKSNYQKTSPLATPITSSTSFSDDGIYFTTSDLTVSGSPSGTKTEVIFVNGNLTIGPITGNQLTYGNNTSGLVFVVKGDINIDQSVTWVDAVLISSGVICTAYSQIEGCPVNNVLASPLTVNGSLISLSPDPSKIIKFMRDLGASNSTLPAEVINYKAKYLVILKDMFSQDITYRAEDSTVPGPYTPEVIPGLGFSGTTPYCSGLPNPANINSSVTWSANNGTGGTGSYTYTWSGGVTGTGQSVATPYPSPTTVTSTVTLSDNAYPSLTYSYTCPSAVNVVIPPLSVTCAASSGPYSTGSQITWSPTINSGQAPYSYSWSGTDVTGTNILETLPWTYTANGQKSVSLAITDANHPTPQNISCTGPISVYYPYNRVFVTSQSYNGSLGGLTGADSKCQTAADNASLGGTWRAWLSDGTNAKDHINISGFDTSKAIKMTNSAATLVANNWDDLINTNLDNNIRNYINRFEYGNLIAADEFVWTNTTQAGISISSTYCLSGTPWNSSTVAGSPHKGTTKATDGLQSGNNWTDSGTDPCSNYRYLYCLEVNPSPAPSATPAPGALQYQTQPYTFASQETNITIKFITKNASGSLVCPTQYRILHRLGNTGTYTATAWTGTGCSGGTTTYVLPYACSNLIYYKVEAQDSGGYTATSNVNTGASGNCP